MLTRKNRKRHLEEEQDDLQDLNDMEPPVATQTRGQDQDDDQDVEDDEEEDDENNAFAVPPALVKQYEQSVVKINVTEFIPGPEFPWQPPKPRDTHGTGSVIDQENGLILTCAHVARFGSKLTVRAANDSVNYPATVVACEADCDLALVQVESPEFLAKVRAVKFGQLQPLQSPVVAIGFPITTIEVTTTTGIVASNEFDDYTEGDAFNLISHTDTVINPGNSGGPVFDLEGHQVGVVFQAYTPDSAEHAGQFTPIPVIQQFLVSAYEALNNNTAPKGIPALPIETDPMMNPALRAHYRMLEKHSGIYVSSIDDLAIGKLGGLQLNDVILSIDGHTIQNDGTIDSFPAISERLDYRYLITSKQIGETLTMKILRQGAEKTLKVPLQYRAGELKLIGRKDYSSESSYYIKNGFCFQPGSFTLLADEELTELGQTYHIDEGHIMSLPKTLPGQELVLLNCVFDCNQAQGYKKTSMYEPVVSVFGQPIHNMAELIHAMETHTDSGVSLTLKNGDKIVVAKTTPEEDLDIVKPYHINKLHSDNYAPLVQKIRENLSQRADTSHQKSFSHSTATDKKQEHKPAEKLKI